MATTIRKSRQAYCRKKNRIVIREYQKTIANWNTLAEES